MKKYLILFLAVIPLFCFSQVGTTEDEWNYAKKGYKILKDNGLSEKEGYSVIPIAQYSDRIKDDINIYDLEFSVLYRKNEKTIAATIVNLQQRCTETDDKANRTFCIPNEFTTNPGVMDMFVNQFKNLKSSNFFQVYSMGLTKYFLRISVLKDHLEDTEEQFSELKQTLENQFDFEIDNTQFNGTYEQTAIVK